MKSRVRKRSPRGLCRPDLVYAGVIALIICVALIARGTGFLPCDDGDSVESFARKKIWRQFRSHRV